MAWTHSPFTLITQLQIQWFSDAWRPVLSSIGVALGIPFHFQDFRRVSAMLGTFHCGFIDRFGCEWSAVGRGVGDDGGAMMAPARSSRWPPTLCHRNGLALMAALGRLSFYADIPQMLAGRCCANDLALFCFHPATPLTSHELLSSPLVAPPFLPLTHWQLPLTWIVAQLQQLIVNHLR